MRICYLADAHSIHTQRWVEYFAHRGYETHLISFEKSGIKDVKVYLIKQPLNIRFLRILAPFPAIKKLIKRIDPDILHAHYLSSYGKYGALCGFKPFVVTPWGSDVLFIESESLRKYVVKRCIARYAIRKANSITVDSKSLMQEIIKLGAPFKKIKLIFHGVNPEEFHPSIRSKTLKEDLGIPSEFPVVISTRRLEPIYNVESLVKAIPHVLKHYPSAYFVIVGEGSSKRALQIMAKRLGIMDHVNFVGKIPHAEIPIYLATSDIYVSTSLSDTTSVSLLEAMACELPVVVTNLEGNREWITSGINGFLIPRKNHQALAEKLIYLLKNEEIGLKFGSINRKIVMERANYEKEMNRMEEIYRHLKEKSRR